MRSNTLWRVTITTIQRGGSTRGETYHFYAPIQPRVMMAVALNQVPVGVEFDENNIDFKKIFSYQLNLEKLAAIVIGSSIIGGLIGSFFF